MEQIIGFFAGLLRTLAFYSVFYAIGNAVLKVLTLGRYPRASHLRENARQGFPELDPVALLGLLCALAALLLVASLS